MEQQITTNDNKIKNNFTEIEKEIKILENFDEHWYWYWYARDRAQIRKLKEENAPVVCYFKNYFGCLFIVKGKINFFAYKYYYKRRNAGYTSKSGERLELKEALLQINEARNEGEKIIMLDNKLFERFENAVALGELTK